MDRIKAELPPISRNSERFADFTITNTSNGILDLLRIDLGDDCYYRYSKTTLLPDETATIRIQYNPTKKGKFTRKIPFYISLQAQPIVFEISGKVLEIPSDLEMNCPDFSTPKEQKTPTEWVNIQVLEDEFQTPLSDVKVILTNEESGNSKQRKSNAKGLVTEESAIGRYAIQLSKEGYIGGTFHKFIYKSMDSVVLYMKRLPKKIQKDTLPILSSKKEETQQKFEDKPRELPRAQYKPNNVLFLIDVSSSMDATGKLAYLKKSLTQLISALRDIDKITIITYADGVNILLDAEPVKDKEKYIKRINNLKAGGTTEGSKAIQTAYTIIEDNYLQEGNNQIYIATDGDFKLGKNEEDFYAFISEKKQKGITLSVLGFGKKPSLIEKMETIANAGGGAFLHIQENNLGQNLLLEEIKLRSAK